MTEMIEAAILERVRDEPMLEHTRTWAAINSGTRNLAGLKTMAATFADAFSVLPGEVTLIDPAPVSSVASDGKVSALDQGRHLVVRVRPDAPVRILLTAHMDTVYPVDHPFQD